MTELIFAIVILLIISVAGVQLMIRGASRSSHDVLRDLGEADDADVGDVKTKVLLKQARIEFSDPLGQAGLLSKAERDSFERRGRLYPILGAAALVLIKLVAIPGKAQLLIPAAVLGFSIGFLVKNARLRKLKAKYVQSLEFFLPIVMERLLMAVQSGFDILAALGAIIELEHTMTGREEDFDPVTRLLCIVHRLAERGLTFDQALNEVARGVDSSALRHAFIHLAVAHSEGGEVVMPLKELSDSTQLYYQESVDEQIAKLPVKATVPLLCTFSGLILFFITSPLIQLMEMAGRTMKGLQ